MELGEEEKRLGQFPLEWLDLRARCDGIARSVELEERLGMGLPNDPLLVDLACGSAANLRHLAPRLGGWQRWLLVDNDAELLDAATAALAVWAVREGVGWEHDGTIGRLIGRGFEATVCLRCADLNRELASCLDGADAVVSSAFLDLAGSLWLDELAFRVVDGPNRLLATLTVDGRIEFWPEDPDDRQVVAWFLRHQVREKGLGVAMGPAAVDHLALRLSTLGLAVTQARSDWELGKQDVELQEQMIVGIAVAGGQVAPRGVTAWRKRRLDLLRTGPARMRIGHRDLYAGPSRVCQLG